MHADQILLVKEEDLGRKKKYNWLVKERERLAVDVLEIKDWRRHQHNQINGIDWAEDKIEEQ